MCAYASQLRELTCMYPPPHQDVCVRLTTTRADMHVSSSSSGCVRTPHNYASYPLRQSMPVFASQPHGPRLPHPYTGGGGDTYTDVDRGRGDGDGGAGVGYGGHAERGGGIGIGEGEMSMGLISMVHSRRSGIFRRMRVQGRWRPDICSRTCREGWHT